MNKDPAGLLEWFGKRKEDVVIKGLHSMSLSVRDCVSELGMAVRAMGDSDIQSAVKAIDRLIKCEHEADSTEDKLCNQISIGELGAQEREDLMHFIRKMDKIANWSKEASINIRLVEEVGISIPQFVWEMLADAVVDLETMVRYLANAIDAIGSSTAMEFVRSIRDCERTIDGRYFEMTKAILKSDMDVKAIIVTSRIVDSIEMAADMCKACSDTIAILHFARKV